MPTDPTILDDLAELKRLAEGFDNVELTSEKLIRLLDRLIAAESKLARRREDETPKYAEHVCDTRCLGDDGHHAWPSPSLPTPNPGESR